MKKIKKLDIIIFLVVIIIFLGALLAFYPGLITSDNLDQLNQAETNVYYDAHPVFHTFIIGTIARMFNSISAVAIFQIIVFALIWTYSCRIARDKINSRLNNYFQIGLTIIICLIPVNFLYSITLWKDILYTYSIFGCVLCIYIGIKNKFNYSYIQMIFTSIFLVAIMQFRHNGYPIGLCLFVIILVACIINCKKKLKILFFSLIFISILIISYIPKWYFIKGDSPSASSTFNSTKIYCMGALLNQDISLEKDEYEILNNILPIEVWKDNYNSYTGGGILFNSELDTTYLNENLERFNEIFVKYTKMYPKVMLKHFAEVNSIFWSIDERGYLNGVITNNKGMEEHELWKETYTTNSRSNALNLFFTKIVNKTTQNKIVYYLFYRPATLMYVSLILLVYVILKTKKLSYILLVFPMGLNIGTYIPFISSQDLRYAYPNFVTCYFILLIASSIFFKYKKNVKNLPNKATANKFKGEVLVIIPAYNEEKSIKDVVNKIYENTTNCDVVVVNDGSKDNTYIEAKKTKAIVIDLPNNLGIGGAVQTGYLYAYKNNYDIAIQVDADGQHDSKYINEMLEILKNGQADMVIGSRFIEKTSYKQTFFRMLGINITSGIIKVLTGKKIHDTTSGFRAINRDIIESFANNYPYDYPEPCTNMEMILKGKNIVEIPVEMKQRETGVSSISPLKSVKYMLKVILSLFLMKIKKY